MYKIEKNINIPQSRLYPFEDMEIGDSFFVSNDDYHGKSKESIFRAISQKIIQASIHFRTKGKKFITRSDTKNNGVRCWRIK